MFNAFLQWLLPSSSKERVDKVEVSISKLAGVNIKILDENEKLLDKDISDIQPNNVAIIGDDTEDSKFRRKALFGELNRVGSALTTFYACHVSSDYFLPVLKSAVHGGRLEDVILSSLAMSINIRTILWKFVKQGNWRKLWVLQEMDLKFVENVITWWKQRKPDDTYRFLACEVPSSFEVAVMQKQCEKDGGASLISHPRDPTSQMRIRWEQSVIVVEFNRKSDEFHYFH